MTNALGLDLDPAYVLNSTYPPVARFNPLVKTAALSLFEDCCGLLGDFSRSLSTTPRCSKEATHRKEIRMAFFLEEKDTAFHPGEGKIMRTVIAKKN